MTLLVLGGTRKSAEAVEALVERGQSVLVSVIRESSRELYPNCEDVDCRVGRLSKRQLDRLIEQRSPRGVLDVTHPHAGEISSNAISVCRNRGLPYLYLDRRSILPGDDSKLTRFDRWEGMSQYLKDVTGSILLTVGVQSLDQMTDVVKRDNTYLRIIPRPNSIQLALDSGATPRRIWAQWPPVSCS
ncbi:MAG: precorrin-6A/cobalt-precorrin-6A reductase, partial [bacterium]